MPYPSQFQDSLRRIEESRPARLQQEMQRLTEAEKAALLEGFHPDYRSGAMLPLPVGVNRGERVPRELHNLLIAGSRADRRLRVDQPDAETDVLVIGAGGAGATAALFAHDGGARVLVATKLRANDSNTVMATGMVTGSGADDSPILHYLDTMGGGRYANVPELVAAMVHDGPIVTAWLEKLGVLFDRRPDGTLRLGAAGGYSRRRSVSAKDFTGLEIMRTLREELKLRRIPVWEFSPAVELLLDVEGRCAGAVLQDLDSGHFRVVRARKTILTTGGMGRLHVQGFPTSNHYGATADGLVMAYRAGARLIFMDSVQFHPTGVVWPEQMFGWLVTERCRGLGGQLLNIHGARFIYERETRDAVASAIIRECEQGRGIVPPHGKPGVWLDTPLIDQLLGRENRHVLSALANRFARYDIDVWKEPILVYPTQHYQNGGILTDVHGQTNVPNLYAAGEVAGGVHGRNRLGGNSLLDIFVFGRRAGIHAASYKLETEPGVPGLHHLVEYEQALIAAGVAPAGESPILLPRYAAPDRRIANDT